MSSISSSSDRTRQDEIVRQTREESEARETESAKRRSAEAKRAEDRHRNEIKNITDEYESRIADLKDRNRETLTDRDFNNNRKIDEVRQTYRDSLRNKMEESYNDRELQKSSYESAMAKQKQVSELQKENFVNKMSEESSKDNEKFSLAIQDNRLKAQQSAQDQARRLNDSHEKEKTALRQGEEDKQISQHRATNEMRKSYESRLKDSERQRQADNSHWSQKLVDTVRNDREEYSDNLEMKQALMNEERGAIRDKFESTLNKKSALMDKQNDAFRDSVDGRLDAQVHSRDSQIQRLNSKLNNEISKNESMRELEKKNLVNAYEKRIGLADEQRTDAIDHMKELNDERVDAINEHAQKLLQSADRENKSNANLANVRSHQERETLTQQHKDQVEQITNTSEGRVQKIVDLTNKNEKNLGKYYADSLDQMANNYSERMNGQRDKATNDNTVLNKAMAERFRGMESSFNTKLDATVKNYEAKLEQLKENQEREMKRVEGAYTQRLGDREKAGKLEKQTVEMQYEAKIAQLNESHQDQLERMNKRHQEDMQNLSTKLSSFSRKA